MAMILSGCEALGGVLMSWIEWTVKPKATIRTTKGIRVQVTSTVRLPKTCVGSGWPGLAVKRKTENPIAPATMTKTIAERTSITQKRFEISSISGEAGVRGAHGAPGFQSGRGGFPAASAREGARASRRPSTPPPRRIRRLRREDLAPVVRDAESWPVQRIRFR